MASADEIIREAQYAFRNISYGSTDEEKYRAIAKKYAKRVIRKYPASIEASQARSILRQLNVQVVAQPQPVVSPDAAAEFEKSHSSRLGHTRNLSSTSPASDSRFGQSSDAEDWRGLVRRFLALPHNKKKMLGIIVFVAIVFPGGIFVVSGLIIFYALQLTLLKKHLNLLLDKLGSK